MGRAGTADHTKDYGSYANSICKTAPVRSGRLNGPPHTTHYGKEISGSSLVPPKGGVVKMAGKKFLTPEEFTGVIPGRGRKPSPLAMQIAKMAEGCPVGSGFVYADVKVPSDNKKERGRVRSGIVTGCKSVGWQTTSVKWTADDTAFIVRSA